MRRHALLRPSRLATGLVFLVLLGLALVSGFRPLYVLLGALVTAAALGYTWARAMTGGLSTSISIHDSYPEAGQDIHATTSVTERRGLPRWGLTIGLRGQAGQSIGGRDLPARATKRWPLTLRGLHRGVNEVGPVTVATADPLGLVTVTRTALASAQVVIYPTTVPLFSDASSVQEAGNRGGDGQSPSLSENAVASGVREYEAGDRLSHIHWPTTARLDRLMSRTYEGSEQPKSVWLLADLAREVQTGSGPLGSEEFGIAIAASLSRGLLERDVAVGLMTNGVDPRSIAPLSGPDQLASVMYTLAIARAGRGPSLQEMIDDLLAHDVSNAAVVIITPRHNEEAELLTAKCGATGAFVMHIASRYDRAVFAWVPARMDRESREYAMQRDDVAQAVQSATEPLAAVLGWS